MTMSKTDNTFAVALSLLALFGASHAQAQNADFDVRNVRIDQKLNEQAPLDTEFRDETGKIVRLGDYLGKKPVLLMLPFYQCPGICKEELRGLVHSLKEVRFNPGQEFEVVIVSINPKETPELAASTKQQYMTEYGRPDTVSGWHFLVGAEEQIKRLSNAIGFYYVYDVKTDQYNHPAGLMVLTPHGKLSRYFFGVQYDPNTVKLALIEASQNKIGTLTERILMYCSAYDPTRGRYGLVIIRVLQLAAFATLAAVGTLLFVLFRLERLRARKPSTLAGGTTG